MSIPLSLVLKQLEGSPSSVVPLLSTLYYDKSILNNISKSDSKHLVSRILNLTRSPIEYNKWAGTNLIRVISDNYTILATEGSNLFGELVKNLDSYNDTVNIKVLTSTVEALNYLCDKIRGKPTMTREILTPKLSTIITLYMDKLHFSPLIIIKSLKKLIQFHPTTFRPFGNKLRAKLITFLHLQDFVNFPEPLKSAIYQTLASLPAIEKTEPELKWESDVKSLIKELKSVLAIYNEFLNLGDDSSLPRLFEQLPSFEENQKNDKILPDMVIDVNEPLSVFQISTRVDILLNLLNAYVTYATQFSVKVPLGLVLVVNEIICSINVRYISYKNDVRDEQIRKIVKSTTVLNSLNSIKFLKDLAFTYKGSMLPHLGNILSLLEVLVPFKNKKIDYDELIIQEVLNRELLSCVSVYLSLVSFLSDHTQLLRFVDVGLLLVEPRITDSTAQQNNNNHNSNGGKKHKKNKNTTAIPLSDILSHQHLFNEAIPEATVNIVRQFMSAVITTVTLPPTQHYKIMRYILIQAVHSRYYNNEHLIPRELRSLLINAVLYPGYEKISLLPIVSTILGDDPLLSVFNNPRFPPLPIYVKNVKDESVFEEEEEEEEEHEQEEKEIELPEQKRAIDEDELPEAKKRKMEDEPQVIQQEQIEQVVEDKIFTKVNPETVVHFAPTKEVEPESRTIQNQKPETVPEPVPVAPVQQMSQNINGDEDESDFEMPEIDVDDSDEE